MSASTPRRELPVVRWLQIGAAAAGVGIAMAAAPAAVASADDSPAASDSSARGAGPAHRASSQNESTASNDSPAPAPSGRPGGGLGRVSAQTNVSRVRTGSELTDVIQSQVPQSASAVAVPSVTPSAATVPAAVKGAAATVASATAPPKATAQAVPSSAPGLGSFGATLRLNIEDVVTGTGRPVVTNPTAVVTGLFNEVLRRDPTDSELQNYLRRLNISGVNGVVAGLYTSDAFRQNAVNKYYLQLLGRTPTQQELTMGTVRLALGTEPNFAASLAGSEEFYGDSASGGGKFGPKPSADSYVSLLYRALLGQAVGSEAAPLIQGLQGGLPIQMAANQFVNTDAYRGVKVGEVYQVIGQEPTPTDITGYVKNWFMAGGQGGISRSLLATTANVQRLEAGLVPFPDTAAAADLQKLLLSYYTDSPDGFTKLFTSLLSLDPNNPISESNPCTPSNTSCNQALYTLVTTGGHERGIPNSALTPKSINADVSTLIPTQNEIDLSSSLVFPLQNATTLATYFAGGVIGPTGRVPNPIVTADDGAYVVDGHHRWSSVYLINPYTQIVAVDVGYVPTPQTALKEAQMGVIAAKGYLKSTGTQGENIYTIDEQLFDTRVRQFIEGGKDPAAVMDVFGKYLMFDPKTLPLDDQYTIVQNYLWANVQRMRNLNPYIPGAPARAVMPQTDPSPIWQNYMGSGALSYSFPTVSSLG